MKFWILQLPCILKTDPVSWPVRLFTWKSRLDNAVCSCSCEMVRMYSRIYVFSYSGLVRHIWKMNVWHYEGPTGAEVVEAKNIYRTRNALVLGRCLQHIHGDVICVRCDEPYILYVQTVHFRTQEILEHAPITSGIYCNSFLLSVLKYVRSDDDGRWYTALTMAEWRGHLWRLVHVRRISLTPRGEGLPVHLSQEKAMGFIRHHFYFVMFMLCNSKTWLKQLASEWPTIV